MINMDRIALIESEAESYSIIFATEVVSRKQLFREKFAALLIKECIKELREVEIEADRAYEAGEVSERQVFDGNDLAELLEDRFGIV